ncbi:hypothetical protein CLOL250_01415 [Clostridium sp. L2-50]|nr:hypothetical protein CLOL250_01415 [Clostridium sp. L2-50]
MKSAEKKAAIIKVCGMSEYYFLDNLTRVNYFRKTREKKWQNERTVR